MNTKENLNKSFDMAENSIEKLWDMWLVTLGSFSWSQEQIENMTKKFLDQNKTNREENIKVVEELMSQAKKNQGQMQKMIEDAVLSAFENVKFPNMNTMDDLSKKVDELSKKVDKK